VPYERYSWSIGKKTTGALGPVRYRGFFNSESKIINMEPTAVSQSSGWRDGQNLILNMNDHGFTVVAYNRTCPKLRLRREEASGTNLSSSFDRGMPRYEEAAPGHVMVKAATCGRVH